MYRFTCFIISRFGKLDIFRVFILVKVTKIAYFFKFAISWFLILAKVT